MAKQDKKTAELFNEVNRHYELAREDLDTRIPDFDNADEMVRSYLDEDTWPYSSLIFIPIVSTAIFEKTSRLIGGKPRGRLVPREGGDVLGAKINNELLSFEWDDSSRIDGEPMIANWARMDMNSRKYGASFALCLWHYERQIIKERGEEKEPVFKSVPYFDGPSLKVLNNRDVLLNPSYSSIKNWFQYREYLTLKELLAINEAAREEPIYKNLDELREKIKAEAKTVDRRDTNYSVRNKSIKGYQDYLGQDETNKIIEIVTEYRPNRWITFAPKHGLVIRDIPNPYNHQQIPVVQLKYYPIDDDIYGLSEIESVEKLQHALNAMSSQYIDAINMELYKPLMIDSTRVRMHTLEFGAGKKWIVSGDPRTAIVPFELGTMNSIAAFQSVYSLLKGEAMEALGETSALTSQLNTFGKDKTATEIKDLSQQRLSRDNFNQIFLAEAIKKQMMFWCSMNKQFYFETGDTAKILRILDKDSISFFQNNGLNGMGLDETAMNEVANAEQMGLPVNPQDYMQPLYPVNYMGSTVPKMDVAPEGGYAELAVEPDDLNGNYDYIADIESMQPPNNEQIIAAKREAIGLALNPQANQMLAMEQKKIKFADLIEDYYEQLGFKDAGKYFENINNSNMMYGQPGQQQTVPGGVGGAQTMPPNQGNGQYGGMGAIPPASGAVNPQQLA